MSRWLFTPKHVVWVPSQTAGGRGAGGTPDRKQSDQVSLKYEEQLLISGQ